MYGAAMSFTQKKKKKKKKVKKERVDSSPQLSDNLDVLTTWTEFLHMWPTFVYCCQKIINV